MNQNNINIKCTKIIKQNSILIETPNTVYVNFKNVVPVSLDDVKNEIKFLKQIAKKNGVKLTGIRNATKVLVNDYDVYADEVKRLNSKIELLKRLWTKHELQFPVCYDTHYNICLLPLKSEIDKFFYADSIISQYNAKLQNIRALTNRINMGM